MPRLPISSAAGPSITLHGRRLVSFGGCNYLGLSYHTAVQKAMILAIEQYGVSTSASRETTGNTLLHDRLEESIYKFIGTEGAVLVPDGYTANLAAAQALSGTHQTAVIDARCHRSIREAIAGAGMTLVEYSHLNAAHAAELVRHRAHAGPVCVWTDGVFASDGSVAPLPQLLDACIENESTLVVDDCHGLGTMGPGGRGTLSHFGLQDVSPNHVVVTSTLAKGVGCHGGFVAGTNMIADLVRAQSTAYICTTPTSPAIAAAAIEAISVIERTPSLVDRLRANASRLGRALRAAGVELAEQPTPIFAFTISGSMQRLHEHLLERGFLAPLISYPDGPAPTYFRLSVTSEHTQDQIQALAETLTAWLAQSHSPKQPVIV